MKFKILLTLVLFFNDLSYSQNLDSLINEAISKNLLLKSFEFSIEAKKNKIVQSSALPSPTLSFEVNQFKFDNANIFGNSLSNSITLSQMFPLGGKLGSMQKVAESDWRLSKNKLVEYKNELITKIKMKYYELWNLERNIEIQQKNIDQLKDLLNSLLMLYQVKKANQSDVILLQSEIARIEVELINLERKKNSLFREINFLIGRENLDQIIETPKEITLSELNFNLEQIDSLIVSFNPELISMQLMIEMNDNEIRANRKELIPDLMLGGMVMQMPKGMIVTTKTPLTMIDGNGKEEIMFGLMASINLPFAPWSRKKIDYKIDELHNTIKSIEFERLNMFQQMRKEIQNLILTINSNKDLIKLYEENVLPTYDAVYKTQLIELETGKISINTILDTNRMILMEKMKYYMTISEYLMALSELDKLIGKNLNKEN